MALQLAVAALAFVAQPTSMPSSAVRSAPAISMKGVPAGSGPFGGSKTPGSGEGWIGDQGKSEQVTKFEKGEDYLFFQGPAPKSAVQEDLPSFFSGDNFADMEISPLFFGAVAVGGASFAAVAATLIAPA